MMFRKLFSPRPAVSAAKAADPRRIWIEEIMGAALPRRADRREAAIAALLRDGGRGAWNAMRSTH